MILIASQEVASTVQYHLMDFIPIGISLVAIVVSVVTFFGQRSLTTRQLFETTFFNMLNLHHEIINSMHYKSNIGGKVEGRECFFYLYREFSHVCQINLGTIDGVLELKERGSDYLKEKIGGIYNDIFFNDPSVKANLGHYFRNFYRIIKFVDESTDIKKEDKEKYTGIARAQLSDNEKFLLFYNCVSDLGKDNFKPLVEQYQLLQGLSDSDLYINCIKDLYNDSAYEKE